MRDNGTEVDPDVLKDNGLLGCMYHMKEVRQHGYGALHSLSGSCAFLAIVHHQRL